MMSMYMRGNVPFVFNNIFNVGTNWTKVSFLYTFGSSNTHFYIYDTTVKTVDISSIKFEKGNQATDWTPAPEDVAAEIAAESAEAQRKAEQAAADYAKALLIAEAVRADAYADDNLTLAEQKAIEKADAALSEANSNLSQADSNLRTFVTGHVSAELSDLKTYIRTDPVNGNLLIGAPGSKSMLRQSNLQMTFEYNGEPVAYFGDRKSVV